MKTNKNQLQEKNPMQTKIDLKMMVISSLVCLLPIIMSLVVYNALPEQMAMQWDFDGNPNWYGHKALAAFGLPLFFFLMNLVVRIIINSDPKRVNQSKAMRFFAEWTTPITSLLLVPMMLLAALKDTAPNPIYTLVPLGMILIFTGNYMNKNRQNYSIGIRIAWTLNDPDNWNKTHRMAGFLWMIGGIAVAIIPFLPLSTSALLMTFTLIFVIMVIIPIVYSFALYKKNENNKEEK